MLTLVVITLLRTFDWSVTYAGVPHKAITSVMAFSSNDEMILLCHCLNNLKHDSIPAMTDL